MADEGKTLVIDSDIETRKGVHSNLSTLTMNGDIARMDFFLGDIVNPDGEQRAVLSARIFMHKQDLVAVRDMIDRVLSGADNHGAESDGNL